MIYISVDCFYVKSRYFMLEWSPSLLPKMPICLDLVNKLCSINNSSIHWKLTLSHWCHAEINYGDPDVINNSLRSGVSEYLCCILSTNYQTHVFTSCKEWPSLSMNNTSFIYIGLFMMVESNFTQSCKIRSKRPNNQFLGSFVTLQQAEQLENKIWHLHYWWKNMSFHNSSIWPM